MQTEINGESLDTLLAQLQEVCAKLQIHIVGIADLKGGCVCAVIAHDSENITVVKVNTFLSVNVESLRVSEAVNLKICEATKDNIYNQIRHGKKNQHQKEKI